jgi:hypothetical protein
MNHFWLKTTKTAGSNESNTNASHAAVRILLMNRRICQI